MYKVSLIIRTFNEEKHLGNLLRAIETQTHSDHEVIIVDSGSTDRTLEIARAYNTKIIQIESRDFTFGYALNIGCEASTGEYLVFVSAHVIPTDTTWLANLIAPLRNPQVAMVYGRQMGNLSSKFSERMDFKRLFGTSTTNSAVPLYYANNANSAIRKENWEKLRFDEYLFGLEDIDWARKIVDGGHLVHYEPSASIYHIHEERWSQVFNRYRREAISAVRIGLSEPPQAKLNFLWLPTRIFFDVMYSFPNYSDHRLGEILRFRYYQWKGSRIGWRQGEGMDFESSRTSMFFPTQNQSVVISSAGKAKYDDVPLADMKPGDILIKVDYVGLCRTDIEVYEGTLGYYRDGTATYPIVPGHEWSGTIAKIGSNNRYQERFKIGQRVVGECILSRGEASERKEVGVVNVNGAYSTFIIMPGDAIHKVPEALDSKTAVLAEPLGVSLRALRRIESRLSPDSRIAVIGAGQIGNLCAQVLTQRGHTVHLFDQNTDRLNILKGTVGEVYAQLENLETYDVIIEATGSQLVLERALRDSKVDATLLLLGFPYGTMTYNFEDIVGKEKVVLGSVGADSIDFENALTILSSLNTAALTSVVMPLEEYEKAWEAHKASRYLKILLKP